MLGVLVDRGGVLHVERGVHAGDGELDVEGCW